MGLYYVTTPIYYVNAEPHAGSAYTTVYADALARYHRLIGDRTFFLTGTDEHGQNILKVANEKGINPQEFVDQMAQKFKDAWRFMRISNDDFIRTTEPRHEKVVQRVIEIMYEKGDIYLGTYQGWYCPKCETYYGENELENGNCPIHKTPVEFVSEESYFFKWSKYQDPLLELYRTNPDFVVPATRLNEIKSFVERGLKDISVSRTSVPWVFLCLLTRSTRCMFGTMLLSTTFLLWDTLTQARRWSFGPVYISLVKTFSGIMQHCGLPCS